MLPHPAFADRQIPEAISLGVFRLRMLRLADLDADMAAIEESAAELKGVLGGTWPEGLTREEDAIDLAWHEREFTTRRSFAFVIGRGERDYVGCAYVSPVPGLADLAEVRFWFRTKAREDGDRTAFRAEFEDWLDGPDWPRIRYAWR